MLERQFGARSGFAIPRANIGAMYLPEDMDEAVALIRHAIDSGMRYIDTSRGYGDSEIKLGKALKDGYREKVILSTKWSPWITKIEESDDTSADCTRTRIEESMTRLEVEYLDFYQIWNINSREHYEQAVAQGGMLDGIRRAMEEGIVGHTGFTTHDTPENLLSYMDEIDWCEIILFTYNILSPRYAPVIAEAHRRGIGTIIMNPLAGGMLNQASTFLEQIAQEAGTGSVQELSLRWLLSNPHVDGFLSGISKISDVDSSIACANAGPLPEPVLAQVNAHMEQVLEGTKAFCTRCGYCMPCSQGIDIPAIMRMISQHRFWGFEQYAGERYREMQTPGADACVQCGACEEKCTQRIEIMEEMACALRLFGQQIGELSLS